MDEFEELLKRNKEMPEGAVGPDGKKQPGKFELHRMERDSEGQERYFKTSEDETLMKTKITQMGVEVATELKDATFEERCEWIKKQKEEGNKLF